MDMIFYSPTMNGRPEERLQTMMEKLIPGGRPEACRTVDDLAARLLEPHNDLTIVLLLAADKDDLFDLASIGDLFHIHNARIIVVVPDRDKDTVSLAHRLRPRLLTYADSDFAEVFAVLNNIISEHRDFNNFNSMHK